MNLFLCLPWVKKYLVFCVLVFSSTYRHRNNYVPSGCLRNPVKTWRSGAPQLPLLHQWQPWAGIFFSYSEELPFLQVCDHLEYECVPVMTVCICLKWGCRRVDVWIYMCVHISACLWLSVWLCSYVPVVPMGECMTVRKIEHDYTSLFPGSI